MKKDIVLECFKAVRNKEDSFTFNGKTYEITKRMASLAYDYVYVSAMVLGICTGVSGALLNIYGFMIRIIMSAFFGLMGLFIPRFIFRYLFLKEIDG